MTAFLAIPELLLAIQDYTNEMDQDMWCQRLKYGKCSTRKCNIAGGWAANTPCDYSLATCPRWRIECAIQALGEHL